jgi:galactokinase
LKDIVNDQQKELLVKQSQLQVLKGALLNRDIIKTAKELFENENIDEHHFGELLSEHHDVLDRYLEISTPKINLMLEKAIAAGAYGGKINGSGGGGCMFVYAPENPGNVAQAIEKVGGKAYIVNTDQGVQVNRE